ncbi:MAG TPA: glycerol-3-phosphate 1-O-acyltransferase PlsY [Thermoanaerobaculia bacterium]|nr:glycerol-3-phosphate 1-O-acyltransferase PlsY [Thermoanaerobaculia bacterium]
MTALRAAAILSGAYLIGSISFSYLLVRWLVGRDLRTAGSGNAGATNALRVAGKKAGVIALLCDVAKGAAAVAGARALGAGAGLSAAAAFAVVLGHVFPLFLGGRGGKGVAPSAGAMGVLTPAAFGLAAILFVVVVARTRYVSLGSLCASLALPLLVVLCERIGWQRSEGPWHAMAAAGLALLVFATHRGNLRRLLSGDERRLGGSGGAATGGPQGAAA